MTRSALRFPSLRAAIKDAFMPDPIPAERTYTAVWELLNGYDWGMFKASQSEADEIRRGAWNTSTCTYHIEED